LSDGFLKEGQSRDNFLKNEERDRFFKKLSKKRRYYKQEIEMKFFFVKFGV